MRSAAAIVRMATVAVGLCAPAAAWAGPGAPGVMPLWIDPQLLAAPVPASTPAAEAPSAAARFTVTRVAADGSRTTEAIDAGGLQALSRPGGSVRTAIPTTSADVAMAASAPKPVSTPVVVRTPAQPSPSETAALQAGARRLTQEPTWTALARRSLNAEGPPQAALRTPQTSKPGGKAALSAYDGRRYGETGRFYVYAAMKNRGVGMNVVDRGESWGGDGLSYDQGGFAGQRSAGIGWRQGEVTTSLGWVHEKTRVNGLYGAPAEKDDRLSLIFSWRPKVPETPPASK